jgi:hypothetical protein
MRSTLENLLMIVGRMHIANQRKILDRILEINDLLSSFRMKQTTPHFGAWLSLINNKSNNHGGQPKIGTALIFKWRIDKQ